MQYSLGLDIGTSAVKALLMDQNGEIVAENSEGYLLATPQSGWAEQNPEDWWEASQKVIKDLISENEIDNSKIEAISFSGQMHSSVFLDKNMEIIRPAILWSDTRTSAECEEIYERVGGIEKLAELVSNPALEGFTAPKILWLRNNEPENFKKLEKVLLPKDYIRYKLSGELGMDLSDAAGTLLCDVKAEDWSAEMMEKLELEKSIMPPVLKSVDIVGPVTAEAAEQTGLSTSTKIVAGGADNACGSIGSGIIKAGRVMASLGSSGVVVAQTDQAKADPEGRIHLFNHAVPNSYYMMGVVLSAGMSFKWMKEEMFNNELDFEQLNKEAAAVAAGSEGLTFLPYLYGERTPHADADARGVFFGISGKHQRGHFIRSVMEGVSFALKDSLELIKARGVEIDEIRLIGGGANSELWQQITADIFGETISLINIEQGPAFGAAIIAGVGAGVFSDFESIVEELVEVVKTVEPITENVKKYRRNYEIYQGLYGDLKDRFKDLK
ncbi:xylulokinase [Halanaerobium saccharolyticum]|uniref:Xylulose kinase n=1 Tax=Halanaerobium saccharolyticum TaxID=43595 RepID=A0A4R7Z0B1_9FIRM|nr:xylulokinase [Halanaerobium saccharolyticum]RAK07216.1 xylulokinase [Halanaerobium saccharolyticum]TDW02129.1 xylulokinase [Halanaerobium saccharolyticum]TDX58860.1 xylulokinase [Halanaerobium saccharolyticum]